MRQAFGCVIECRQLCWLGLRARSLAAYFRARYAIDHQIMKDVMKHRSDTIFDDLQLQLVIRLYWKRISWPYKVTTLVVYIA